MLLAAIAMTAELAHLRAAWPPPGVPWSPLLPFVIPELSGAREGWLVFTVASCVWGIALVVAVRALLQRPAVGALPFLLLAQAALSAIVLCAEMPTNADQYLYVGHAELVRQGYNPYAPPLRTRPVSRQLNEIASVWSIDEGAPDAAKRILVRDRYGPAWTLGSSAILAPFAALPAVAKTRVLRLAAVASALLCTLLLWRALAAQRWGPAAVAAFALNPSVVMQTALGAHNDVVALLFALLAFVLAARGRLVVAALALSLSVAVKLTFAPFVPVLLAFALGRRGVRGGVAATAAFVAPLLLAAWPFGLARSLLQPIADMRRYNGPILAEFSAGIVQRFLPHLAVPVTSTLTGLMGAALVGCALGLAVAAYRGRRVPALEAALVLLIFAGARFEPWYAIVLTPLLLVRAAWSMPLFVGVSLAAQVLVRKEFIGGYMALPLREFLAMAVVVTAMAAVAMLPAFSPAAYRSATAR